MYVRIAKQVNDRHKKGVSVFGGGESQITFHFPNQLLGVISSIING